MIELGARYHNEIIRTPLHGIAQPDESLALLGRFREPCPLDIRPTVQIKDAHSNSEALGSVHRNFVRRAVAVNRDVRFVHEGLALRADLQPPAVDEDVGGVEHEVLSVLESQRTLQDQQVDHRR